MNLRELLRSDRLQLPQAWKKEPWCYAQTANVTEHLDCLLSTYAEMVIRVVQDDFRFSQEQRKKIVDLTPQVSAGIVRVIERLRDGQRHKAMDEFQSLRRIGEKDEFGYPTKRFNHETCFFRARTSSKPLLELRDLFHIPFELRHLVRSQRYSIPGVPCVYLGSSLLGCWHELGCPSLNEFHFARFEISHGRHLRLVNFNYNLGDLAEDAVYNNPGFLIWWPLLAACSMERAHGSDASFHEEYLMPQLFMEHIAGQGNLDGIVFFSCHHDVHHEIHDGPPRINPRFINYAIPVKNSTSRGFCDYLADCLKLTDPISWQVADTLREDRVTTGEFRPQTDRDFRLGQSTRFSYAKTKFRMMERLTESTQSGILPRHVDGIDRV